MSIFNVLAGAGRIAQGMQEGETSQRQAQLDRMRVEEARRLEQERRIRDLYGATAAVPQAPSFGTSPLMEDVRGRVGVASPGAAGAAAAARAAGAAG